MRKKIPEIRFKEFSKEWKNHRIGELSEVKTGKAFSSDDFSEDGEYLVITNKNIQDNKNGVTSIGDKINISDETILDKYLLKDENILITMDGVNIGKTGKYSNEKAILAQRVGRLNSEQIEFIYQVTTNNKFLVEMKKLSVGNAIKHISLKQISDYSFAAPISTDEQNKIGNFLKYFDENITLNQHALGLLKQSKKGFLQKMFPKKGESVPELRFSGFTADWKELKSKEICSISTGKSNTQDKNDEGEYPFYVRSATIEKSSKYLYDEEAVLTVGDGVGTGKVYHYVNGKYDLHQRVYRMFNFKAGVSIRYFYYYFSNHFYRRVQAMTAKTSVDSVRLEMIADMNIIFPSSEEQNKIGKFFNELDASISLQEQKIESLKQMKKAFLLSMFV